MLRLCRELKDYRMDFLEIIIENLVNFDTELVLADEWVHKPFPEVIPPSFRTKRSKYLEINAIKMSFHRSLIIFYIICLTSSMGLQKIRILWEKYFWFFRIKCYPSRPPNLYSFSYSILQKVARSGQRLLLVFCLEIFSRLIIRKIFIGSLRKVIFIFFHIFSDQKGFPAAQSIKL